MSAEKKLDGRKQRGNAKREIILNAALRVIERDGAGGASQRAVGTEAGVSGSLLLYHFGSVERMLVEALKLANARYLEQARSFLAEGGDPLDAMAIIIADSADHSRHLAVAEFELTLLAARDKGIRRELTAWWEASEKIVALAVPDPQTRRAVMAAIDGMFLRQVVPGQEYDRDEVRAILDTIISS